MALRCPLPVSKLPRTCFLATFAICLCAAPAAAIDDPIAADSIPDSVPAPQPARPGILNLDLKPLHDPALRAWMLEDWQGLIRISSAWAGADPSNPVPWRYLGDGYFGVLAMDKAATAYRKALELEATAMVWESLGETHLWRGVWHDSKSADKQASTEFERALVCLQSALALDPDYAKAFGGIGAIRYHQKKYQLAMAALERNLENYPEDARSWHYLGMAYAAVGDDGLAVTAFQAAAELTVNSLAQLRNWLLLKQSAEKVGRDELVREADQNLVRIVSIIRARQRDDLVAGVSTDEE